MRDSRAVNVLYMEDDWATARITKKRLEQAGYLVDLAANGQEGLAKYDESSFDVLLVDNSMPICDGITVIRTLASRGPLPPLIMVTAGGSEKIAVDAMKLGASDYLVKGASGTHFDLLPTLIERAWDQHQLALEKQRAEEALRESEGKLNAVLDAVTDHIGMMDSDQNITWANGSAKAFFGHDMVGRKCYQVFRGREEPCEQNPCSVHKAFGDGKDCDHDDEIVGKSGNRRHFHCSARVALRDLEENPTALIQVLRDTTEHKLHEKKVAAYNTQLEKVVEIRTAELEKVNQQLQQDITERKRVEKQLHRYARNLETANSCLEEASTMAREASRAKSEFLSNVSHEIRTPLNGIIGFAEMILASRSLDTASQQARVILKESEHLLTLINDILDDAKIESGKVELEHSPLDPRQVVQSTISPVHVQAREKGLELSVVTTADVPRYVLGDALRIRQVLLNLVGNAVKFTQRGFVDVRTEVIKRDDCHARLRFSVSDTGIGVPKEKQEAIFASFSQADESTTRKYGGTGLGTSIARKLVHLMGGQMGLESEPGKGSTFWFNLDVEICPTPPDPDAFVLATEGFCERGEQTTQPAARILLAEDYPTNQQLARAHLESAGYMVDVAENGSDAVAASRETVFDLILMDLHMPQMDGYEAARLIRAGKSKCADIPILAMTANVSGNARRRCRKASINDVITKPVRRGPFLATIARWLSRSDQDLRPQELFNETTDNPDQATTPNTPLHYEQAVEEFGGNRELLHKVTGHFLRDLQTRIPLLREAVLREDAESLRGEAHKIRGGAANLTAMPLAATAERLEMLGESSELARAEKAMDEFEEEFQRLRCFVSGGYTQNESSETLEKGAPNASSRC